MELRREIASAIEFTGTRVTATLQDPVITLSAWEGDMPALCIEEGGVVVELEFQDIESLRRFKARLAALGEPEAGDAGGAARRGGRSR